MCELISEPSNKTTKKLSLGEVIEYPDGTWFSDIPEHPFVVMQCWHPETEEWNTMLPPVEGMAWELSPGSRIRIIQREKATPPSVPMVEQVEKEKV